MPPDEPEPEPETDDEGASLMGAPTRGAAGGAPTLRSPLVLRDAGWAALFAAHLAALFLASAAAEAAGPRANPDTWVQAPQASSTRWVLGGAVSTALLFTAAWAALYARAGDGPGKTRVIVGAQAVGVGSLALLAALLLAEGHAVLAAGVGLLVLRDARWLWLAGAEDRLPFFTVQLEIVHRILAACPQLWRAALAAVALQSAFLLWWTGSLVDALVAASPAWAWLGLALHLASLYWVTQAVKAALFVAVSGTVTAWFFSPEMTPEPRLPGLFLRRALGTSLGSVCRGALLALPARWVWELRRALGERLDGGDGDGVWGARADGFVRRNHKFALVHVAAYSKPFAAAAADTWRLLERSGVDAAADDDVSERLVLCAAVGCGGLVALVFGAGAARAVAPESWVALTLVAFLFGYATVATAMEIVEGAITTLFACFATDPERLRGPFPVIYHRLQRLAEMSRFGRRYAGVDVV